MADLSFGLLFVHWLAFFDTLQQFFWNYTPRPLLSTIFPGLIGDDTEFSPIVHVPPDYTSLTKICLVSTVLQTFATGNVSCSIEGPTHDPDDAPLTIKDLLHYYVFLDTPWQPAHIQNTPPTLPLGQVEVTQDDDVHTNMASYGARGLSFCPVLVGIAYIHSLLHLYMLLMMPSLFNHWFEDALVYDSLIPMGLLDCSLFLYASLWVTPWRLFRYGAWKIITGLCWQRQRVARRSTHTAIPRIILVRVDGEAVPVKFAEDHRASVDVDVWSLEPDDSQTAACKDGKSLSLVQSVVPCSNIEIATWSELLSMQIVSPPDECHRELARAQDGTEVESFTPKFDENLQVLISDVSDQQEKTSPEVVEAGGQSPHSVEKNVTYPILDTTTPKATNSGNVEEGPSNFQHTTGQEVADDNICEDGTDSHRDKDKDQHLTPSRRIAVEDNNSCPSEGTDTVMRTRPPTGSQDPSLKNVGFATHGDAVVPQVPLCIPLVDEYLACVGPLEGRLCDSGSETEQVPLVPYDPSMDITSVEKAAQLILSVVLGEEVIEEIDTLAQCPIYSFPQQPIVDLPSPITTRENVQVVGINTMFPAAPIEDVATRSPLQMFSPIVAAVVIDMTREIQGEIFLAPLASEEQNRDVSERTETIVGLSTPVAVCGVDTTVIAMDPSGLTSLTGKNGPVQESQVSASGTMVSAVSKARNEPETDDQVRKSDRIIVTLPGQNFGLSCIEGSRLSTMKQSDEVVALPCKQASLLPVKPEREKYDEPDNRNSSQMNPMPWDRRKTESEPPRERTLSSSMHAPSSVIDSQPNKLRIDQAPTIDETFLLSACSVHVTKADDGKAVMNVITENRSEREPGLFASVHAPTKAPEVEAQSIVSQPRDGIHCGHRRSVTTPVVDPERKSTTKPCSPNRTAVPDVVDAFRVFRDAPRSKNSSRKASSIAESTNKAPTVGVVGQKGIATNSLNSVCVTVNSRQMNGSGPLLVRDVVPSDPADFNLRTCMRSNSTNAMPMQQVLHPGVQRKQSALVPHVAELETWFSTMDSLPTARETEVL